MEPRAGGGWDANGGGKSQVYILSRFHFRKHEPVEGTKEPPKADNLQGSSLRDDPRLK